MRFGLSNFAKIDYCLLLHYLICPQSHVRDELFVYERKWDLAMCRGLSSEEIDVYYQSSGL